MPSKLSRLKNQQALGPNEQIGFRCPVAVITLAEELAEVFETTRADVLRDFIVDGYSSYEAEWQQALSNGKKVKK